MAKLASLKIKRIERVSLEYQLVKEANGEIGGEAFQFGSEGSLLYGLLEPGHSNVYLGLIYVYNIVTKTHQFFPFPKLGVEIPLSVAEYVVDFHVGPLKEQMILLE